MMHKCEVNLNENSAEF